jgi:D-alanyl-D-alanine dipeptidase
MEPTQVTPEEAAQAIMNDIMSRKGLKDAWAKWWKLTRPQTKEALYDAWIEIIRQARD